MTFGEFLKKVLGFNLENEKLQNVPVKVADQGNQPINDLTFDEQRKLDQSSEDEFMDFLEYVSTMDIESIPIHLHTNSIFMTIKNRVKVFDLIPLS